MEDGELLVQMNGLRPTLVLSVTLSDIFPLVEPLYMCVLLRLNNFSNRKLNRPFNTNGPIQTTVLSPYTMLQSALVSGRVWVYEVH